LAGTSSSASAQHQDLPASLSAQLEAASTALLSNNWVTKPQLDNIRQRAMQAKEPVPSAGRTILAQFLLDNRLLPRDQVQDLDAILRTQATLPDFHLQKKIGAGGMGTVFLAQHLATKRQVALKTINARLAEDKDFVERFHREARALEALHHPHIAEIIGCGETDGTCWLAMEYIDGPSLMSLLKDHRVLPERYALHITLQVAEGLGHVWQAAKLVHRDIKPENVLVVRSRNGDDLFPVTDEAKLIDFGLVKSNNEDDRLTQTGMTIGTPLYMSPEQVRGEKLDCRSDIYGLGATLYHLLTGQTPFTGSSPGAIMSAHLTEAVPDPGDRVPSLSKATRQLVMTAMAKDVEHRYLTLDALISGCRAALEGLEHRSGSIPKLLRKPLVMKNPVRRSGEIAIDPHEAAALEKATPTQKDSQAERAALAPTAVQPTQAPQSNRLPAPSRPITPQGLPPAPPPAATPAARQSAPAAAQPQRPSNRPGQSTSGPMPAGLATRPRQSGSAPVSKPAGISTRVPPHSPSTDSHVPPTSAAYIDPPTAPGVGMLPWIAVGFAVLALAAVLAVSYL
jgi:serine/threonine protein kinase